MMLTLLTSGTIKAPKKITHSWNYIEESIERSIKEIGLTSNDKVLDVFPANTIAHYTITAVPAYRANASLVSTKFDPKDYLCQFNQIRPTYIALIPRHWELLKELPEWQQMDLSSVRYMVTGSSKVPKEMIDDFLNKGVKIVANWYGMTEMPPPVFVGYNSEKFDFFKKSNYNVEFTDDGECVIDGFLTGDIFDTNSNIFLRRKESASGKTWKTF